MIKPVAAHSNSATQVSALIIIKGRYPKLQVSYVVSFIMDDRKLVPLLFLHLLASQAHTHINAARSRKQYALIPRLRRLLENMLYFSAVVGSRQALVSRAARYW